MGGELESSDLPAWMEWLRLQAIKGHDVTGFGLLYIPLLTLALFGVCGCLYGFSSGLLRFVCFSNTPRPKPSLGLFIFGCVFSCDQHLGMFYVNKNKTRLIQIPATLPSVCCAKDKAGYTGNPQTLKTH